MDKPQPLKRELIDGEMTIEGEKYPLLQDGIHTLWLTITDIDYIEGYSWYEGKATFNRRVRGTAHVGRSDTLKVAGWDETTKKLTFNLKPGPSGEEGFQRRVIIGHTPYDWEFGPGSWWCEAYITADQFDRLTNEMHIGRATDLMLMVRGLWWIRSHDRYVPSSMGIHMFLIPDESRGDSVRPMFGEVESISWGTARAMREADAAEELMDDTDVLTSEPAPLPEDPIAREIGLLHRTLVGYEQKAVIGFCILLFFMSVVLGKRWF